MIFYLTEGVKTQVNNIEPISLIIALAVVLSLAAIEWKIINWFIGKKEKIKK